MGKPKVLVVLTSAATMGPGGKPTGWYLPELAHPYYVLKDKVDMEFASLHGGVAPLDQGSVEMFKEDAESQQFLNEENEQRKTWTNTKAISNFKASDFDAIFYPGGHGPVIDLADDATSLKLIRDFYEAGKPTAAVCHGPVVFVNATLADGKTPLVKGKTVTGFTNVEEEQVGLLDEMRKFHVLEDDLQKQGATFVKADPWGEKVVTDGNLITGQNPASARGVGEAIAKALGV